MRLTITFLILIFILGCKQTSENKTVMTSETEELQDGASFITDEEFETLDVDNFNDFLANENDYLESEVLMLFYPGNIEGGGEEEIIDVREEVLENGNTMIFLTHDNLEQPSIKGYKYILELKRDNNRWKVVSAKRNWRYYEGKGHTYWGIDQKPSSRSIREVEPSAIDNSEGDENFKYLTIGFFNRHLGTLEEKLSGKEVMRLFLSREEESKEGNQIETLKEEVLPNGNTMVTLVEDNLMDDSMKAEQHIMELKKEEGMWHVVYVKTNWKCREGRGHTDWGIDLCL
ncbi:hypothetical protein EI546_04905 [Aequorivita sp. H23M31]|uniref:Lipoprotein n=1 Tax=Aequorivita ciconiae TaxID=2494375 RepID=A0A410G1G2_9FLAO|nr:hypothetical protein [Aequorivita sp. H23M31]QAA81107.1 hypothetical protein EI546_04905 [Aequorivita sp. H23M31]